MRRFIAILTLIGATAAATRRPDANAGRRRVGANATHRIRAGDVRVRDHDRSQSADGRVKNCDATCHERHHRQPGMQRNQRYLDGKSCQQQQEYQRLGALGYRRLEQLEITEQNLRFVG